MKERCTCEVDPMQAFRVTPCTGPVCTAERERRQALALSGYQRHVSEAYAEARNMHDLARLTAPDQQAAVYVLASALQERAARRFRLLLCHFPDAPM